MTVGRQAIRMPRSGEHGFTMVEVLVTIVLIGIVVSIAGYAWYGIVESRAVDSATNQVVADLRLAHTSATNQLTSWRVVYNAGGSSVTGCGSGPADYCLLKMSGTTVVEALPRSLPDGTRVTTDNALVVSPLPGFAYDRTLQFKSDGSMQALGVLLPSVAPELTVSADDGDPSTTVSVNLSTSRVQVNA
jgi:type IV fimbrial biogenesis protein FimT